MNCDKALEYFLLDEAGELAEKESGEMRAHIHQCASCRVLAEELSAVQGHIRGAFSAPLIEPSADFDRRVMAAVRQLPGKRTLWQRLFPPPRWRPTLTLAGAAAAMTFTFALGFWGGRHDAASRFAVRSNAAPRLMNRETLQQTYRQWRTSPGASEIVSAAPDRLSAALTERVRFPVRAVDLRPEGATLIGGDSLALHGTPIALMRYRAQGEQVALLQMDASALAFSPMQAQSAQSERYFVEKRDGMTCITWRSGNVNNVMIAQNLPMHTLFHLACHTCEKQGG